MLYIVFPFESGLLKPRPLKTKRSNRLLMGMEWKHFFIWRESPLWWWWTLTTKELEKWLAFYSRSLYSKWNQATLRAFLSYLHPNRTEISNGMVYNKIIDLYCTVDKEKIHLVERVSCATSSSIIKCAFLFQEPKKERKKAANLDPID